MIGKSELRISCATAASSVRSLRHALEEFLRVFRLDDEFVEDVLLASGEVLANAVEHGAGAEGWSQVELVARGIDGMLAVDISDSGRFIERERGRQAAARSILRALYARERSGRGCGLGIVRQIARSVTIDAREGTRVRMLFDSRLNQQT